MAAPAFSRPHQTAARVADPALRQALLKYARRRLPHGEAEDLVQNTLTEALVSNNAPSDDGAFQRWVHGIARHKIADGYRRRGRQPVLGADVDSKAAELDAGTETEELAQWIESELPRTDGAKATLHWLLRESDGESLDDIARDAALPAPRVRQRVSRLRRHFHSRWLALSAAGLSLLVAAGIWYRWTSSGSATGPAIAREAVTPFERASTLRRGALEKCASGAYRECVAELDRAQVLDPAGESAGAIRDARAAAGRALESGPQPNAPASAPPLDSKSAPKPKHSFQEFLPKVAPKAAPKKQKPLAPLFEQNSAPRKLGAEPFLDLNGDNVESKKQKPSKKD